jgi:hypothetical protein
MLSGKEFPMNESVPSWLPVLVFLATLQTILLAAVCVLIGHWAARMNRKLRAIQAAVAPEQPNPNRHTGAGGNFTYVSRRKHARDFE